MKNIFVLSSNMFRLRKFDQYYNVLNEPTTACIRFIIDDRHVSADECISVIENMENVGVRSYILVSDIIKALHLPLLCRCPNVWRISLMYGVSIKLLVFIYAKLILNIDKSMMLDDDVLFLKPIDEIFDKHDYVKKQDGLTKMTPAMIKALASIFDGVDIEQLNAKNQRINSGTLIYTWRDDSLLRDVEAFFTSPEILSFIKNSYKFNRTPPIRGVAWTLEQCFYSCHLARLGQDNLGEFGAHVRLLSTKCPKDLPIAKITKLPNIMHFLIRNKKEAYDYYEQVVTKYINNIK